MKTTLKSKKCISIFLVFVLLLNTIGILCFAIPLTNEQAEIEATPLALEQSLPETLSIEQAMEKGHVQRLANEETELNSAKFLNADGTYSTYLFQDNIKYIDSSGNTVDKSNKLERSGSGYTNPNNDITAFYPDNISMGISLSYNGYTIRTTPVITGKSAGNAILLQGSKNIAPGKITYANVFGNGTSIEYTQTFTGFKEVIIINQQINQSKFTFNVFSGGLSLRKDGGRVLFVDNSTDKSIMFFNELIVWDSAGNYFEGVYEIEQLKDSQIYSVSIVCDDLISNSSIQYPLYIDPATQVFIYNDEMDILDRTLYTNYADNTVNNDASLIVGNYDALMTGNTEQRGTARSLVRFHSEFLTIYNQISTDYNLTSVKYNFALMRCDSPTLLNAYMYNYNWQEWTYPTNLSLECGYFIGKVSLDTRSASNSLGARYELDVTTAAFEWANGVENNGFMLKLNDESQTGVIIGSSEMGDSSGLEANKPMVVINFSRKENYANTIYKIRNVGSGKYLAVSNGYVYNKQNVIQHSDPVESSDFKIIYGTEDGYTGYRFFPMACHNGKSRALDIVRSGKALAAKMNVQVYNPTDGLANTFAITDIGNGQVKITTVGNSSLALTAYGNSNGTASGKSSTSAGNVFIDTYSETNNYQKWELIYSDEALYIQQYYASMNLAYPFRGSQITNTISSDWGYRNLNGSNDAHPGTDFGSCNGYALYSIMDGKVIEMGYEANSRGYYIIIEATNDYNTAYGSTTKLRFVYMHMAEAANVTNPDLCVGAIVTTATRLGTVGNTGASSGAHLHLSIITNGGKITYLSNTIDPLMFYPNMTFTCNVS